MMNMIAVSGVSDGGVGPAKCVGMIRRRLVYKLFRSYEGVGGTMWSGWCGAFDRPILRVMKYLLCVFVCTGRCCFYRALFYRSSLISYVDFAPGSWYVYTVGGVQGVLESWVVDYIGLVESCLRFICSVLFCCFGRMWSYQVPGAV